MQSCSGKSEVCAKQNPSIVREPCCCLPGSSNTVIFVSFFLCCSEKTIQSMSQTCDTISCTHSFFLSLYNNSWYWAGANVARSTPSHLLLCDCYSLNKGNWKEIIAFTWIQLISQSPLYFVPSVNNTGLDCHEQLKRHLFTIKLSKGTTLKINHTSAGLCDDHKRQCINILRSVLWM